MGCPRPQQYCGNLSSPPVDGASCTLSVRTRSSNVSTDHIQDVVHEAVASIKTYGRGPPLVHACPVTSGSALASIRR
jgi:hypothetical protein